MNWTNYDQLRWCERYKNTLVFQHVEAFAKKVRSKKNYQQDKEINAIAEQNEIDVFFKENWEYEHVHSNLSCDISNPIYIQERVNLFEDQKMMEDNIQQGSQLKYKNIPLSLIDNEKNKQQIDDESVKNYYKKCYYFIQRLKSEHENETAFKIEGRWIEYSIPFQKQQLKLYNYSQSQKKFYQNLICARKVYKNFFETIGSAVQQMEYNARFDKEQFSPYRIQEVYQNISLMIDQNQDQNMNLKLNNKKYGNLQMDKWIKLMMEQKRPILKIHQFMANFVGVLQQMNKQKRSCLFNFQPQMDNNIILTYLIHPILLSLYASHHKERISWQNQYEHNVFNINFEQPIKQKKSEMEQSEHTAFDEDTPHFEISRTVFINLDGYESQFNIQFAKNMRHHLMYISFPIFDKSVSDENMTFNNRFFKKLFFNYTRNLYEYNSQQFDTIINKDFLDQSQYDYDPSENLHKQFDPQFYFKSIANMYKDKTTCQNNSNINIFPILFKYLQEQLSTLFFDKNSNASACPSYFIYYIFQNFLLDDIRKFNPAQIVISFSGKINIIDEHFIKLIQQLAVISKRRVMFYPNFTTKLVNQVTLEAYSNYDNFLPQQEAPLNSYCNIDLMRKMSQFLKICSGTYNLQLSEERETIIPKYKLAKLNKYIRGVLNALSNEQFPHLKNKISQLTLRTESFVIDYIIQQNIDEIKKSIPPFYQLLFDHLIGIIKHPQNNKFPPTLQSTVQELRKQYKFLVDFQKQQMSKLFIEDIYRKLQLEFVSQRYSQFAYVYFKTRPDKRQFQDIREQLGKEIKSEDNSNRNRKQLNNLSGLYALHLRYSKQKNQKISIPIYPHTQLLYRQNQIYKERRTEKRKYANLMLMNHLQKNQFVSFAGLVPINFSQEGNDQKKIKTERAIQMYPIRFNGMPQLAFNDFIIRSGWNYAETSRYFFLFWPLEFNLIEAKLHYLRDQIYEPNILNQFYICQIPEKQHRLTFNRVMINEPIAPRRSCSCLELITENKIIIMGGFYSKQDNYLSLQTQITGIDLSDYAINKKCKVTNQKGTMYQFIKQQKSNKKESQHKGVDKMKLKGNSYVPARRQYQFFQLQQLCDLSEQEMHNEMNVKTYIMMGGFGESFNRPYSLINYFYYIISVNMQTKTIDSIQRRIIHEKFMHSNIKGYIKNNKYFEKLPLYEQQKGILKPELAIGSEQYVAHRSVYSFSRKFQSEKYGELEGKTKYLFAINIYNKFKKQYKNVAIKIGEYTDEKTNETYDLKLSHSPQGNHYLTISKKNQEIVTQLYLQKIETKSKFQQVPLTHGSIISIDIRFKYISAIIKHDSYTSGRYVLAQCEIINEHSELILKVIHEFKQENLQQYYLFVPRANEVLLLHGLTFKDIKMEDICISSISKKEQIVKKIPFPNSMNSVEGEKIKKCVTFMIKGQSQQTKALQIQSINLLLPTQARPSFYIIRKYRLKFNSIMNEFAWQQTGDIPVVFVEEYTKNVLYVFRVQEGKRIQLAQNQVIQPALFSLAAKEMTERNSLNIIIRAKFTNSKSQSMTGIGKISVNACEVDNKSKPLQILVGNMENKETKRVWELGTPLISHTKSMSKYEDMQDYNSRNIGMSE